MELSILITIISNFLHSIGSEILVCLINGYRPQMRNWTREREGERERERDKGHNHHGTDKPKAHSYG